MASNQEWVEDSWLKNIAHHFDWKITKSMSDSHMKRLAGFISPKKTTHDLVRIGASCDGGYLVPDDLHGIDGCFSPGVATTATFEEDMLARGVPCFLADASVNGPPIKHENLTFDPLFLGPETKQNFISLDDWVEKYAPNGRDLVLQMDIEGAEYDVLEAASDEVLSRFRIILIEFHGFHHSLRARSHQRLSHVFEKLNKQFIPVHSHPNNVRPRVRYLDYIVPRIFEVSFIRRDRIENAPQAIESLPHVLDVASVPSNPDPALPQWMWSQ